VTHLLITKAAAFATLAFFGIKFLRRKRPSSSIAPILVFCNFFLLFGLIELFLEETSAWHTWGILGLIAVLSFILNIANKAESNRIFKDNW
jgi:hypothetical protein